MRKYKTFDEWNGARIEIVEIERESESSVWIDGRRYAKSSNYEMYHDSFEAAKTFIESRASESVAGCERKLERLRTVLAQIQQMELKP